jgi:hypothetical protein
MYTVASNMRACLNMALGVRDVRGDAEHVVTEIKIFLVVNAITSWLIMLVAQNSATDSRYALVQVICRPFQRQN